MLNRLTNAYKAFSGKNLTNSYNIGTNAYSSAPIDYLGTLKSLTNDRFITQDPNFLEMLERVNPIVKRYNNQPVDDAFKDGFTIKTPSLSQDEITTLYAEMRKRGVIGEIKEACKLSRLYGGSIIVFGSRDRRNGNINAKPVSLEKTDLIKAVRRHDFSLVTDHDSLVSLSPIQVRIQASTNLSYNGIEFHPSRLVPFVSNLPKSLTGLQNTNGWGLSSLEHLIEPLVLYKKEQQALLDFVEKLKIQKLKVRGVAQMLKNPNGQNALRELVERITNQLNASSVMMLDKDDEFSTETISLTGIRDAKAEIRKDIMAATGIPAEKLFGNQEGGTGLGGTQDQLEVYNAMVTGEVQEPSKQSIIQCTNIVAKNMYDIDQLDDVEIEFPSLRESTDAEMETIKTSKMDRLIKALNDGLIGTDEAIDVINSHDLLGVTVES